MKLIIKLGFLLFITAAATAQSVEQTKNTLHAGYVSLEGQSLPKGIPADADGNVRWVSTPMLRLIRTTSKSARGTILLMPGGGYQLLKLKNEGIKTASYLNAQGFDVAILYYRVAAEQQTRNMALQDALKAFRMLKANRASLGLRGLQLDMMGFSSGGHLAARTVQRLSPNEQPDKLILISPEYLDETLAGTVFPAVMPPLNPGPVLFATFSANDKKACIASCSEYAKTWKGYDGEETFTLLPDSAYILGTDTNPFDKKLKLPGLLQTFLTTTPPVKVEDVNPSSIPVEGYSPKRHAEKSAAVAKEKFDLIMLGNSITNNFEKSAYQSVWNQFYAPRHAINLGFSGYRTENILWNIQHGELDGQSPKVLVLEIGTNNIDEKNYPTRHTAGQLAGGIAAIVNVVRQKLPFTKIIILRCFPGCYGGPNPTSHRAILERASNIVSKMADGENIFYCDVNHVFLNFDGSINRDLMPDYLHPSPAGAKLWAQAMEPLLSKLMGDQSLDTDVPANTAIVPVIKLENDSYNWFDRHAEVLRIKDSINPQIVLIGNSITHFWGGEPKLKHADGTPRKPNGPNSWAGLFGQYRVLNLGFGWDRTQNALWRLDNGEVDGLHPQTVVIDIGTNNTSQTDNARMNTAPEIVDGIRAVCLRVRSKLPGAQIILMAVFPREQNPDNPRRILINEIDKLLEAFAKEQHLTYVDIGPKLLAADGTFLPGMMLDFTHPTDKGYQVWADALRPLIAEP
ncbi:GDSL-type esterase/lipase family protein [Mucilaginibacter paludis]|uniref:Lipolytic protein G-D-S-L family n=1 Tax=Mucilaginibacter paludis DSM 18603 TaxID=714943 RepID=H1YA85_9SPHI|nr:GDSL-type esterase/lipase family protein [Mucilaginibacter paludis]EHQ25966.1 lipolytic protein G-D-S-L family [Mucilaginibacter paludis DSM 18603]